MAEVSYIGVVIIATFDVHRQGAPHGEGNRSSIPCRRHETESHHPLPWDLTLGKPVQEINFPQADESDAIYSLVYHPKAGILVLGHPTRNSVYLLHVSSARYNLPMMFSSQVLEHGWPPATLASLLPTQPLPRPPSNSR